jgi:hypothetical protein
LHSKQFGCRDIIHYKGGAAYLFHLLFSKKKAHNNRYQAADVGNKKGRAEASKNTRVHLLLQPAFNG